MTTQLHNTGEEYYQDALSGETFTVMLYHDGEVSGDAAGDDLEDSDDIGAITTEPSQGSYARQTETFVSAEESGNWVLWNDASVVFDVTNTIQTVDAYAVVANFDSDENNTGSGANDHLITTGNLDQAYDLSSYEQITLDAQRVGVSLD